MDQDEKLKMMLQHCAEVNKFFLGWRYKIVAGFIVIISALWYFTFTWIRQPENYSIIKFGLACCIGIFLSMIFLFINWRITILIWRTQNKAYLIEKSLGFDSSGQLGLYGTLIADSIRDDLDKGKEHAIRNIKYIDLMQKNPLNHSGLLNWFFFFIIVFQILIFLLQIQGLRQKKEDWEKLQKNTSQPVMMKLPKDTGTAYVMK